MEQIQVVEKISHSFIESWNDQNPTRRLDPELIKLLDYHFLLTFVAGLDGLAGYLLKELEKENFRSRSHTIGIRAVQELIKSYKP